MEDRRRKDASKHDDVRAATGRESEVSGKRLLRIEDLDQIEYLSAPAVSPAGDEIAFVQSTADVASGGFISRIFTVPIEGGRPTLLDVLGISDSGASVDTPRYSPDGSYLAFLSIHEQERQIYCLDRRSGEVQRLSSLRHGVDDFEWSPGGETIAFTARLWLDEQERAFTRMTNEERVKLEWERENSPAVVEELVYKYDDSYGLLDGRRRQIGIVDLETGSQRLLTLGRIDYDRPAWSPDGTKLACYGRPFPHALALRSAIFAMSVDGEDPQQLTGSDVIIVDSSPVVFTSDARYIVYCGYHDDGSGVPTTAPFLLPATGGEGSCLFSEAQPCHGVGGTAVSRTAYGALNPAFRLDARGDRLWFLSAEEGNNGVYTLPLSGGKAERVTPATGSVHSFCAPVADRLVYTRGEPQMIAELFALDLPRGEEKRLTFSNNWLSEVNLAPVTELWSHPSNESPRVHGFVITPPDVEPDRTYPAVLYVRGGPDFSYGRDFWFELQYLAANGLAVVACDPRGSAGYGTEFQKGDVAFGPESMSDLFSFLDAAIERTSIDGQLLGVTGGSYGGHMTNRIISRTDRFRAAVTQRTLCNLATSYGTGDIGFVQNDKGFTTMLNMLTSRARSRSSTISKIDSINIPLLILHGTHDYRCSFEQAEQMFVAMKERRPDVPVRLVAFPGENHEITRSGRLHFQKAHLEEMTQWFLKYLQKTEGTDE